MAARVRVVVMLFCLLVFLIPPSSAGGRKLEIKKHLKRLNKRAVKTIKVRFFFPFFHFFSFFPFFPFPLIMILIYPKPARVIESVYIIMGIGFGFSPQCKLW